MKAFFIFLAASFLSYQANAQASQTTLYNLVKQFAYDSTGYTNVGDWAIGKPKRFPVKWKADRIEMSEDTSINFFREGTVSIPDHNKIVVWKILLKGARSGYTSYSMMSPANSFFKPGITIDSLFGQKPYKATLLKNCERNPVSGFNYYEIKFPKKDPVYLKLTWLHLQEKTAYRIDVYDSWSNYAVKLNCK